MFWGVQNGKDNRSVRILADYISMKVIYDITTKKYLLQVLHIVITLANNILLSYNIILHYMNSKEQTLIPNHLKGFSTSTQQTFCTYDLNSIFQAMLIAKSETTKRQSVIVHKYENLRLKKSEAHFLGCSCSFLDCLDKRRKSSCRDLQPKFIRYLPCT